jgi:hypothetical protein
MPFHVFGVAFFASDLTDLDRFLYKISKNQSYRSNRRQKIISN